MKTEEIEKELFGKDYSFMQINDAINLLRKHNYFVDKLYHLSDITLKYRCSDDEARELLYDVFEDKEVVRQINDTIDEKAFELQYKIWD